MTGLVPIKIALVGEVIFGVSLIAAWLIPTSTVLDKIVNTVGFFVIVWFTAFVYPQLEREIAQDCVNKRSNRRKVHPFYIFFRCVGTVFLLSDILRISMLTITLSMFVTFMATLGFWIAAYFLCCDPLPPGTESKLKKFLSSHRLFWKPVKN